METIEPKLSCLLNHQEIRKLIKEKKIIKDYLDLDVQLTPNGFDLTCGSVFEFNGSGTLDFSNKERVIPEAKEIMPKYGWWNLKKGAYKIRTNESFNLPPDLAVISFPRSSLLRMGAFTHTAVWDAGFKGRSEFILMVENPKGIRIKQNARMIQVIFLKLNKTSQLYQGVYQER